jgi:adenine phosphoribosyltransferase
VGEQGRIVDLISALIRDVPDFPKPGIIFKDMSPLLADHAGFSAVIDAMVRAGEGRGIAKVVGIESRGFIFGAPVALALGAGFVTVRKEGKLPGSTHSVGYALEYGEAVLEMHQDAISPGERVLVVDDVLATGGTLAATRELVETCGGVVAAVAVLLELAFLDGRSALRGLDVHAVHTV